jgi:hypothetical protein
MAIDLQCAFPNEMVRLSQVSQVPGLFPRTLDIIGEDFRSVNEVLVNGILSPSFVIVGPQRLLAQVPSQVTNNIVSSVSVLSNVLTLTAKSLIKFQFGTRTQKVSGLLRLCQFFLKVLFTTPGRDIFSPNLGGAGLKNIGRSFAKEEGSGVVADLYVAVTSTVNQITALQSRNPRLPREEKLLSATVISAQFNPQELALIAAIELLSQTGQFALANVML